MTENFKTLSNKNPATPVSKYTEPKTILFKTHAAQQSIGNQFLYEPQDEILKESLFC